MDKKYEQQFVSNNPYTILGVPDKCSDDQEIKQSFRLLALQFHPDRVEEDDKEQADIIMKKINNAYSLIRDQESRDLYVKQCANPLFSNTQIIVAPIYNVALTSELQEESFQLSSFKQWVKQIKYTPTNMSYTSIFQEKKSASLQIFTQSIEIGIRMPINYSYVENEQTLSDTHNLEFKQMFTFYKLMKPTKDYLLETFQMTEAEAEFYYQKIDTFDIQLSSKESQKLSVSDTNETIQIDPSILGDLELQMMSSINRFALDMFKSLLKQIIHLAFKGIPGRQIVDMQPGEPEVIDNVPDKHPDIPNCPATAVLQSDFMFIKYLQKGFEEQKSFLLNQITGQIRGTYHVSESKARVAAFFTGKQTNIMVVKK